MQRVLFIFLLVVCGKTFSGGLDSHEPTQALLNREPIQLTGRGRVAIAFQDAVDILDREDLLTAIQFGYAALLPEGETPEFTVTQTGPGTYYYVNTKGQETSIEEVLIETVSNECVRIVLYSEGRRFFGNYQSLCEVEVVPVDEDHVDYTVTVYAHPDSGVVRFFARITPVELYFRHKLNDMTGLVIDVCNHIKDTELELELEKENHVVSSF